MQFSSDKETSVCNLASLVLPSFVDEDRNFELKSLHATTKVLVRNLNRVIDTTLYPTASAATNNLKHRPLGVGVQGLSDTFTSLMFPFDSPEAHRLNEDISQTIYHAALEASTEIAEERRGHYQSFEDSPTARGLLQFDLWNVRVNDDLFDWSSLRERIKRNGLANSLLIAYMPTAGTTQITGFSEACEPIMRYNFTSWVESQADPNTGHSQQFVFKEGFIRRISSHLQKARPSTRRLWFMEYGNSR